MEPVPQLRRPFGIILLCLYLFAYVLGAAMLFTPIERLHVLLQLPIWLILGLAWLLPLKPFLRWMETGQWR
ncbi:DUF2842 domain-containing protein [Sandaracinobacteroides saxicola]|uniref:DUF2842 domain-containing protein n=1 Tax=Sandaracinobacteroides saxicola TaxID=2759707 RepID=A0A7G5IK69_9SPHN|nr:DUF2842 domain-containing protein [Sandaracinobacteroides saxicola]QMW23761.1 DUF2842 domain-containing protein [Sandaracinobacteroides saxicola]